MTVRHSILTLAVAGLACAAPAAQAHLLGNDGAVVSKSSASTKSTLAVMTAAGTRYHAASNYTNELRLLGQHLTSPSSVWSSAYSSVRPDDRAGVRGI